jgi:hypothetical protein
MGESTMQHCRVNSEWLAFAETIDLSGYTREQRENLRAVFYAGVIAGKKECFKC